jgi:PPOX class probable F420-dependent enzyme
MGTAAIAQSKTILLTSYRRGGTPVTTPVSVARDGDRAVFRTWDTAWKARRLRRSPRVQAAPATLRGRARVPPSPAAAGCWRARRRPAPAGRWPGGTRCCTACRCRWRIG